MSAPTFYHNRGRRFLVEMLAQRGCTRGAEIGVWEGAFSEMLCKGIPNLSLICVDPWRIQQDYVEVKKNQSDRMNAAHDKAVQRLQSFDCKFMRMTSLEAAELVPDGSLDFVYIDGNHLFNHVLADLKAWSPKVRAGGFVAGHDYGEFAKPKPFIQVKDAVDQFTLECGIDPWFVLAGDKSPSYFWEVKRCAN